MVYEKMVLRMRGIANKSSNPARQGLYENSPRTAVRVRANAQGFRISCSAISGAAWAQWLHHFLTVFGFCWVRCAVERLDQPTATARGSGRIYV